MRARGIGLFSPLRPIVESKGKGKKNVEFVNEETKKRLLCTEFEYSLKQEFEHSVKDRVERYFSVYQWKFTPHTHFALISAECRLLYRDGYFFACIALCQSVAEALARFLCEKKGIRKDKRFAVMVHRLRSVRIISEEAYNSFKDIYKHRNGYHHLNPGIPTQREKLQGIALRALKELSRIENEVFAFCIKDGVLIPKYPNLWQPETLEALQKANNGVSRDQDRWR
jgi:hypothetical protein